jgi:CRISPR-associated endonuclease/helicase Cas3
MMLTADDFPTWFSEVWGHGPFPWQRDLALRLLTTEEFPPALDLPTGAGKTAAIDVALFALAARPAAFPRRIVLVVDRRVIVDQAAERAEELRRKLVAHAASHPDSVSATVARALRACWGGAEDAEPFGVAVLRGGMPRETLWSERPDKPYVLLSTVDQVGSRLLFRGYGVSPRSRSIHAGLLGNDCLFLLDEVHLSVPFAETLRAARAWRRRAERSVFRLRPWAVVPMSATRGATSLGDGEPLTLTAADHDHPQLAERLRASKPTALELVKTGAGGDAANTTLARALAARATTLLREARASTALVVVNRVDTARRTASELRSIAPAGSQVALLTGRMRPIDRDEVVQSLLPRLRAGRDRQPGETPLFVVATQCIEAGADFDVDVLVTECASLDALRQRFGRLDRLGRLAGGARAAVLLPSHATSGGDPIYGDALAATWTWLQEIASDGRVDFGLSALPLPPAERQATLVAPVAHAPVLLPAHLDLLAQTNPTPVPDPVVAHWLHGPERASAEVQLVWRADLEIEPPAAAQVGENELLAAAADLLALCPPTGDEAMAVPLHAARAWLAGATASPVTDVPALDADEDEERPGSATRGPAGEPRGPRRALRWSGPDEAPTLVGPQELRPGDVLVVPASWGGVGPQDLNWAPESQDPVVDRGDEAQWHRYGALVARLSPALARQHFGTEAPAPQSDEETEPLADQAALVAWLLDAAGSAGSGDRARHRSEANWRQRLSQVLATVRPDPELPGEAVRKLLRELRLHALDSATGKGFWVVTARRTGALTRSPLASESDSATAGPQTTFLDDHLADVVRHTRTFAERLQLPPELIADLELAASLHDAGKADPRFQTWLAGGNEVRRLALGRDLAKSLGNRGWREQLRARERSGYPAGARHELLSAALARASVERRAHDPELVLHLIESHHGYCRSLAPVAADPNPRVAPFRLGDEELTHTTDHGLARLDSGVADRFWSCQARYGWWGLALLETILRLADHEASRGPASS